MKIGDRVGAVLNADDEEVVLLGYGVYEGDFCPPGVTEPSFEALMGDPKTPWPTAAGTLGEKRAVYETMKASVVWKMAYRNPRIRLDDGQIVWGRECWWGPEEKIKAAIEKGDRQITYAVIVRDENGLPTGTGTSDVPFSQGAAA